MKLMKTCKIGKGRTKAPVAKSLLNVHVGQKNL